MGCGSTSKVEPSRTFGSYAAVLRNLMGPNRICRRHCAARFRFVFGAYRPL